MKRLGKSEHLLDLIDRPAFTVMHEKINHVNQAARAIHIEEDTPIWPLLPFDQQAYTDYTDGCLYLTVRVFDVDCGASVTRNGKTDIFILDDPTGGDQLAALALAGNQLKAPVTNINTLLETYFTGNNMKDQEMIHRMNQLRKNFISIHRSVLNMSDCCSWISKSAEQRPADLTLLFAETMEKCAALLSKREVYIRYTYPQKATITMCSEEMLVRAMYNMVSNAVKYSVLDPFVEAELTVSGDVARISVQSPCHDEEQSQFYTAFTNYLRKPSLEDGRLGIGLGMTYIRSAALSHHGTALIDRPVPNKIRVSITVKLTPPEASTTLHSQAPRLSNYAGGLDLALIELADVLPAECYDQ